MKKIIRLTESDLARIVKRVINEQKGQQQAAVSSLNSYLYTVPHTYQASMMSATGVDSTLRQIGAAGINPKIYASVNTTTDGTKLLLRYRLTQDTINAMKAKNPNFNTTTIHEISINMPVKADVLKTWFQKNWPMRNLDPAKIDALANSWGK